VVSPCRVFVYGEIGLDNTIQVPYFPTSGKDAGVIADSYEAGGAGSNVAIFLANWGIALRLSGNVLGDDFYGKEMLSFLKAYPCLDLQYLKILPGTPSPFCRIIVNSEGDRIILFYHAENLPVVPLEPEMLEGAGILVLDLNGGSERVEAAITGKTLGLRTVVTDVMSPDHPILPYSDLVTNSAVMIRHRYPGVDVRERAFQLQGGTGRVVITTDGPRAIHVVCPGPQEFWVQPPRVTAVDTTGCGDALKAGVIYGMVQDWSWQDCVRWGAAAGSLNARQLGASSHPPSVVEVADQFRRIQVSN